MTRSITHRFFFPHPPEMVWEYLTNAELMELWLMKNNFQPVLGCDFQFTTKPITSMNLDGVFHCRVLEITPFTKLSYSWKGGPGDGNTTLDSLVVWKLEKKENGTELFLEHSGFSEVENFNLFNAMNQGWLNNIHKIAERLNAAKHGTTNT